MSDVILEAKGIQKSFGGVMAVAGVSLTIRRKEIFALIGPNGAGKTTMFNLISGAHSLDQGEVIFEGKPVHGKPSYHIAAMGLIRTFQNLQIFGTMTVLENVMVGSHLRGKSGFLSAGFKLPGVATEEKRLRDHAMGMLTLVGMESRANDLAPSLPFGQQRLVEIARALAASPKLLMLDEPAAGLTRPETCILDDLISRIRENGVTVLLVEHDMNLVMGIADRMAVLQYGSKIAEGTPAEMQANTDVIGAYLGVDWEMDKPFARMV